MMKMESVVLLLLVAVFSSHGESICPADCSDLHGQLSGVHTIYPAGEKSGVEVYCDLDTDGGRWTVFQRRSDGFLSFYRPWTHYKVGFGYAAEEFWLGLDNIHYLTQNRRMELRVDMEDFDGKTAFALYSSFSIDGECEGYKLNVSGFKDGGAGDALTVRHNGQKFSTFDKDQDVFTGNCAKSFLGAFWYEKCHIANPNGIYRWGDDNTLYAVGMCWQPWRGHDYSLKSISMKIRPVK